LFQTDRRLVLRSLALLEERALTLLLSQYLALL
jgi:hypothetical protein